MVEQFGMDRFLDARRIGRGFDVIADRVASEARSRLIPLATLTGTDRDRWDELGDQAGIDNPFCQPWLQGLALERLAAGNAVHLAVVEDCFGSWLGAVPLVRRRSARAPVRQWTQWGHANQFTGTPLVRPGHAAIFWRELLARLDAAPGGAVALALQNLPLDESVIRSLFDLSVRETRHVAIDRHWQRAVMDAAGAPCEQSGKSRRRIEALERKLAQDHGPLSLELTHEPERIAALADSFVALEASGWKGRGGSALASRAATQRFFCDVAAAAAQHRAFEIGVLRSGGRIVAMSTQLLSGRSVHGFKTAYDEAFAAYAPGLLLLCRLTAHWQNQGDLFVDSCTKPGQEPVSRLWPGRRELVDCRIALGGPGRRAAFAALLAGEGLWHGVKRLAGRGETRDKA